MPEPAVHTQLSVHLRPSTRIDITVRKVNTTDWLSLEFGASNITVFFEPTNRHELVRQLRQAARAIEKKVEVRNA